MRTVVLCLLVALMSLPRAVHAEDKLMRWYFNTTLGGKTFDMLQCQALTFDWDQFGDGQLHSVWRFPDEAAYDACDFRRATEERSERKSGVYTIRGADTLPVTKMWFGSREGDDCRCPCPSSPCIIYYFHWVGFRDAPPGSDFADPSG